MTYRYYLTYLEGTRSPVEVTKQEFVRAERAAGFRNTMGQPDEPATAGFTGPNGVRGVVRYEREARDER